MKYNLFVITILAFALTSCDKELINEKKLGGIWEGKKVQYLLYGPDSKLITDSTVDNSGALYLYDDDELYNQYRYSLRIAPAGFAGQESWEGNGGDPNTLLGTNIRKLNRRKMELSENVADSNLHVTKTVIYYFERQ